MTSNDTDQSGSGWTQRVASFYSHSAESYEELWAPELLKVCGELVDGLPIQDARRILDLGCGVGALLPAIQEHAPDAFIVGSDISHGMLRRASDRFGRITADASLLPFRDDSADAAVLAFMLFHVPEPQRAVAEIRRVVKEGGAVGTATWGGDPSYLAFEVWNEELDVHGAISAPPLARHDLVDTADKMERLLTDAGFRSVHTWTGWHEEQQTLETFLRHRLGHGTSRHRLESLSEGAQQEVIEAVSGRLAEAGPAAFLDRTEVVYAIAV